MRTIDLTLDGEAGYSGYGSDGPEALVDLKPDTNDGFAGLEEPAARVDLTPDTAEGFAGLIENPSE